MMLLCLTSIFCLASTVMTTVAQSTTSMIADSNCPACGQAGTAVASAALASCPARNSLSDEQCPILMAMLSGPMSGCTCYNFCGKRVINCGTPLTTCTAGAPVNGCIESERSTNVAPTPAPVGSPNVQGCGYCPVNAVALVPCVKLPFNYANPSLSECQCKPNYVLDSGMCKYCHGCAPGLYPNSNIFGRDGCVVDSDQFCYGSGSGMGVGLPPACPSPFVLSATGACVCPVGFVLTNGGCGAMSVSPPVQYIVPQPVPVQMISAPQPIYIAPQPVPVQMISAPQPIYFAPQPVPVQMISAPQPIYIAPQPVPVQMISAPQPIYFAPQPVIAPQPIPRQQIIVAPVPVQQIISIPAPQPVPTAQIIAVPVPQPVPTAQILTVPQPIPTFPTASIITLPVQVPSVPTAASFFGFGNNNNDCDEGKGGKGGSGDRRSGDSRDCGEGKGGKGGSKESIETGYISGAFTVSVGALGASVVVMWLLN